MIKKGFNYLFVIYVIVLFLGIIMPNQHFDREIGIWIFTFRLDKWLHFYSYFGLTILFALRQYVQIGNLRTSIPIRNSWYLLLFTPVTEMLQLFTSDRGVSLKDVLANAVGVCFGIVSLYLLKNLVVYIFTKTDIIDKIKIACVEVKIEDKSTINKKSMSFEPVIAES